MQKIDTGMYSLILGKNESIFTYKVGNFTKVLKGPSFEVNGEKLSFSTSSIGLIYKRELNNVLTEYRFDATYVEYPMLKLGIVIRISEKSPILKFKYVLSGDGANYFTKKNGEHLDYFSFSVTDGESLTEVRLSEFNEMLHSFCMSEIPIKENVFTNSLDAMGPILAGTNGESSYLLAYEHGSQYPDAFIRYKFTSEKEVILSAKKGNYLSNMPIDNGSFETIWFDFGAVCGNIDDLAASFREFQLKYSTLNSESRKPYIYYNTWNYQERNMWWNHRSYLADMDEARMLDEIDSAHEMGIEVFVIDTGWYNKTGDWKINEKRFPSEMKKVRERLESYGMKLGLWIGPRSAAVTSDAYKKHIDCKIEFDGKCNDAYPIWETEESYDMCLVSEYWEELSDSLIFLAKNYGVTYFKWDAVRQYGCNCPNHYHGNEKNTAVEREDSYAFQLGIYLEKIVNRVCAECPDVIIDFDITEGRRSVGLGFLSVGKYFLINNGPYYKNYNLPWDVDKDWTNIFVHPGAARTWICRTPMTFDKWIPSVLFLTHYLPDDPINSQDINIASLILGQNGIWGDLPKVSKEGKERINEILSKYKSVRDDITAEAAIKSGMTGSGFECYEKISSESGKGVVCVFSNVKDTFKYITEKKTHTSVWSSVPANVTMLSDGSSMIEISFDGVGAAMIFFGC